jgi:putative NADPH-quinone reductase
VAKRIFVLDGHPGVTSFVGGLTDAYIGGVKSSGCELVSMKLSDMEFDVNLGGSSEGNKSLETSIVEFQKHLKWCDHFVFGYPLWWGYLPAKTKGLFDRALIPNFAYAVKEDELVPTKLLTNRSVHVFVTSDTPGWHMNLVYRAGGFRALRMQLFDYCGMGPVKTSHFSPIRTNTESKRNSWLKKARIMGAKAGQ